MALRFEKLGPAALITAAFIGPGTVTTATRAGADYGTALLWALLFSVFATLILQEMSLRLGVVARQNLAEALRQEIPHAGLKKAVLALVLVAILGGAIAYEAGNILGASLGMAGIIQAPIAMLVPVTAVFAAAVLWMGKQRTVETIFMVLVAVMSMCFLVTAILVGPELLTLIKGFVPSFPGDSTLLVVALIGTTVVPYNLFLHSALASQKYFNFEELSDARFDNRLFILLGGIVSMSIVVTASVALNDSNSINGAADFAKQLEPLLGKHASVLFSLGLLAAGITSSITAPLAAGYVCKGVFGWDTQGKDYNKLRYLWLAIIVIGTAIAMLDFKPVYIITVAQYANGLLLPVVVAFLLYAMNQQNLLGKFTNTSTQNAAGGFVLLVSLLLAARSLGVIGG